MLIQESAALPACANVEAARAFVARVDDSAPSNALAGWPMARLAASLFDDGEREVARAALRYVGLRGDRLTQFELERRADGDIEAYLASGEWRDKAGGYAIQENAERFGTALEGGGFDNVVGLPVARTLALLLAAGASLPGAPGAGDGPGQRLAGGHAPR